MEAKPAALIVKQKLDLLNTQAKRTVFNEWALVKIEDHKWKVLMHQSPRQEQFKTQFKEDISSLKSMDPTHIQIGEFGLSETGYGTKFDAYLCAGENIFFLFNNLEKTVDEITSDSSWETAQAEFETLQNLFILDPVI